MDWTNLEDRLAHSIGLDAKSLGSTVFRHAVHRRMRAREIEALPDYIRLLDSDSKEFQKLVEELVVRESWFFRQAHAFELLQRHARSTMAGRREPYRVLSFPCAGAEEPYSVVISLREAGLGFDQFQVHAADISETALLRARSGSYGLRSIRALPDAIQERYFRITPESVEVLPEIRLAVHFTQANIVDLKSLMRGTFYDAVFCRNLLIYLTPDARQRVMQEVDRWLAPGGLFFVGHAEMLRELETRFEPVRERGVFAYLHRPGASSPAGPLPRIAVVQPVELASRPARQLPAAPSGRILARTEPIRRSSPAPGVPEIGARVGISSTSAEPVMDEWVQKVSELANLSRHAEAIAVCEQQLQKKGPSPQLYHMLGMVCQAAGLLEKAEQALERAVYLDPNHEEALLALALLARRRGAVQVADRLEQRSQRAHDRRPRS